MKQFKFNLDAIMSNFTSSLSISSLGSFKCHLCMCNKMSRHGQRSCMMVRVVLYCVVVFCRGYFRCF